MKKQLFFFSVTLATLLFFSCSSQQIAEKTELTEERQKELATAVFTLWIDDCGGIIPEPEVDMPNRLSTPIAYTTSENFRDPFGKSSDRLFFLPEKYFANSGAFAIISRGPDGDLDSRDISNRTIYEEKTNLTEGVPTLPAIERSEDQSLEDQYFNWFSENDVHQYDPSNGTVSDGDLIKIYF